MIQTLSKEQRARFPEFVEKWVRIGLSTAPIDMNRVREALVIAYGKAHRPTPKVVVKCTSPLATFLTRGVLSTIASVSASVSDSVRASVSASVYQFWYWDDFGQYSAWWYSFFDFMTEVLGVSDAPLEGTKLLCQEAGMCLLFWDYAFISERPMAIHRNAAGQLHRDGGPALVHSDGWGVWALNGIRMPYEYVETPAGQLKPGVILAERNADIRRELLRKVGIERMLSNLPHRMMDRTGNYELFSINLGPGVEDARYLKMLNPSVGCFHLEGVAPECDTVEKSLNWRNQNWHENAEVLS
jgi:hypothetical protein